MSDPDPDPDPDPDRVASLARSLVEGKLAAAERELERWRHGVTVEGDVVCPDSLALTESDARLMTAMVAIMRAHAAAIEGAAGITAPAIALARVLDALDRVIPETEALRQTDGE